jgi:hypothetical protein
MSRGFLCPVTEEVCENGACLAHRCVEQEGREKEAELAKKDYEAGIKIDLVTLLDSEGPVTGEDRHGMRVYRRKPTDPWKPIDDGAAKSSRR